MSSSSKLVALITGASQGIGKAIALRLSDEGYDIALNDIPSSQEKLISLQEQIIIKGRRVCVAIADVSMETEVEEMIRKVVEELGSVDIMVANAGVCVMKPFLETTVAEWERTMNINTRGAFLCYKYAAQQMIKQGRGGRIIGASSVAGKQGGAFISAYSASKFAIRGLTQSAACELGKHAITVNAYAPGAIDTPMLHEISEKIGGWDTLVSMENSRNPVGYIGKPEDIASLVCYLASKESHFITGQSISVNGGWYFD